MTPASWSDMFTWGYILAAVVFSFWLLDYARDYWHYWKRQGAIAQELRRRNR